MVQTIVSKTTGMQDIIASLKAWKLVATMSFQDIKQRYRGSILGPLWIAGSLVAISLGIGILYSSLFSVPFQEFMPFVAVGMMTWMFLSSCLTEGCNAFLNAGGLMRNTSLPVFVHTARVVGRNTIVLGHNIIVVFLIFALFQKSINANALAALPGMLTIVYLMICFTYIVAVLSTRFRDVGQIVNYLTTVVMFLTPLFWNPNQITGARRILLDVNPFFHMIELVREPLMGNLPSVHTLWAITIMTILMTFITLVTHSFFHRKIILWL